MWAALLVESASARLRRGAAQARGDLAALEQQGQQLQSLQALVVFPPRPLQERLPWQEVVPSWQSWADLGQGPWLRQALLWASV